MSKQLKPVIQYGDHEPFHKAVWYHDEPEWLCLPLTPASRRRMIEAIEDAIRHQLLSRSTYDEVAEAALAALEKMAGEKA